MENSFYFITKITFSVPKYCYMELFKLEGYQLLSNNTCFHFFCIQLHHCLCYVKNHWRFSMKIIKNILCYPKLQKTERDENWSVTTITSKVLTWPYQIFFLCSTSASLSPAAYTTSFIDLVFPESSDNRIIATICQREENCTPKQ